MVRHIYNCIFFIVLLFLDVKALIIIALGIFRSHPHPTHTPPFVEPSTLPFRWKRFSRGNCSSFRITTHGAWVCRLLLGNIFSPPKRGHCETCPLPSLPRRVMCNTLNRKSSCVWYTKQFPAWFLFSCCSLFFFPFFLSLSLLEVQRHTFVYFCQQGCIVTSHAHDVDLPLRVCVFFFIPSPSLPLAFSPFLRPHKWQPNRGHQPRMSVGMPRVCLFVRVRDQVFTRATRGTRRVPWI